MHLVLIAPFAESAGRGEHRARFYPGASKACDRPQFPPISLKSTIARFGIPAAWPRVSRCKRTGTGGILKTGLKTLSFTPRITFYELNPFQDDDDDIVASDKGAIGYSAGENECG